MIEKKQRTHKLDAKVAADLISRQAQGTSYRDLQDWLLKEKGIKYSHVSIKKLCDRSKGNRTKMAEAILKPMLTKTLTSDLLRMEDSQKEIDAMLERAKASGNETLICKALDRRRNFLALAFSLKGLGKEEEAPEANPRYLEIMEKYNMPAMNKKRPSTADDIEETLPISLLEETKDKE